MQLLRQVSRNSTVLGMADPSTFLERLNALAEYALVHQDTDPTRKPN